MSSHLYNALKAENWAEARVEFTQNCQWENPNVLALHIVQSKTMPTEMAREFFNILEKRGAWCYTTRVMGENEKQRFDEIMSVSQLPK